MLFVQRADKTRKAVAKAMAPPANDDDDDDGENDDEEEEEDVPPPKGGSRRYLFALCHIEFILICFTIQQCVSY